MRYKHFQVWLSSFDLEGGAQIYNNKLLNIFNFAEIFFKTSPAIVFYFENGK